MTSIQDITARMDSVLMVIESQESSRPFDFAAGALMKSWNLIARSLLPPTS